MVSKNKSNAPRLLGATFLLQAVASAVSLIILRDPLIIQGNIIESMNNISDNAGQMQASIVLEMVTAIGIVMLGTLLFETLKKLNRNIALIAKGLYIMEATLLAVSSLAAFALIRVSQESVISGHPAYMQALGNLLYESMQFGNNLHMLPFSLGATMFYFLFHKSGFLPRILAVLGIVAAPLAVIGTLFLLLGFDVPLTVFIPNLPFELGAGVWFLFKGISDPSEREIIAK